MTAARYSARHNVLVHLAAHGDEVAVKSTKSSSYGYHGNKSAKGKVSAGEVIAFRAGEGRSCLVLHVIRLCKVTDQYLYSNDLSGAVCNKAGFTLALSLRHWSD